jgi:hypothetical protein
MRRVTTVPEQDRNCNDIRMSYNSLQAYESTGKPSILPSITAIGSYSGDQVINFKNSRDGNETTLYNTLISRLQVAETQTNRFLKCLQTDILQRNDYTSRLYTLQQEVEEARKTAEERKQTASEAKERVSDVQDPYSKTTWWETWFPLGRPIQKENVPVLLSVSILMLVFSLGIFLRFAGQDLKFVPFSAVTNTLRTNLNPSKYP